MLRELMLDAFGELFYDFIIIESLLATSLYSSHFIVDFPKFSFLFVDITRVFFKPPYAFNLRLSFVYLIPFRLNFLSLSFRFSLFFFFFYPCEGVFI